MRKEWRSDLGLLVLRVILGLILTFHGSQKMFGIFGGPGYKGTLDYMSSLGFHPILANIAMFSEFLGGLMLCFGLLTIVAGAAATGTMAVATWINLTKSGVLEAFWKGGMRAETSEATFTLALCGIGAAITIMGAGGFSMDAKLFKGSKKGR